MLLLLVLTGRVDDADEEYLKSEIPNRNIYLQQLTSAMSKNGGRIMNLRSVEKRKSWSS
jgi:hypothetical protein